MWLDRWLTLPPSSVLLLQEQFAELFGNNAMAKMRQSEESFKKWLLVGMTVMTVMVVGSVLARNRL